MAVPVLSGPPFAACSVAAFGAGALFCAPRAGARGSAIVMYCAFAPTSLQYEGVSSDTDAEATCLPSGGEPAGRERVCLAGTSSSCAASAMPSLGPVSAPGGGNWGCFFGSPPYRCDAFVPPFKLVAPASVAAQLPEQAAGASRQAAGAAPPCHRGAGALTGSRGGVERGPSSGSHHRLARSRFGEPPSSPTVGPRQTQCRSGKSGFKIET
eukprot:7069755-Prymnesium_polylepis.1